MSKIIGEIIIKQDGKVLPYSKRASRISQFTVDFECEYKLILLFWGDQVIAGCDIFLTEDEFIINLQYHFEKYDLKLDKKLLRRLELFGLLPQGGLLKLDHQLIPISKPIVTDRKKFDSDDIALLFERYESILKYFKQRDLAFQGSIDLAGIAPCQISHSFIAQNEIHHPIRIFLYQQIFEFERFYFIAGDRIIKGVTYYLQKISEFKDIVFAENTNEADLQKFIENNFWIWGFEYCQAIPKQTLGEKFEIDFLLKRIDGKTEIVEIERSNLKLFTKNLDPTKELTHAIRQVRDYQSFCLRNYSYLTTESKVKIFAPKGHVVIGNDLSEPEKEKLAELNISQPNIEVYTYDYLIKKANSFIETLKKVLESN